MFPEPGSGLPQTVGGCILITGMVATIKTSNKFLALDLFAGAGGISYGLEMAGFDVIFANEISPEYSETLRHNHPNALVTVEDIRNIDAKRIRKQLGLAKGELSLLAGGPPCQGFSINAPIRSTKDERNHLFLEYLKFVDEFKPQVVLIENVPGMVSFNDGDTVKAILESLDNYGYHATVKILYAPHYGVPQMRWRTVFLATHHHFDPLALFPSPSHSASGRSNFTTRVDGRSLLLPVNNRERSLLKESTVKDAISDLPPISNGCGLEEGKYSAEPESAYQIELRGTQNILWNHVCAGLGPANLARLPHIPPGGSWRDIPFELLPDGMKRARRSDHTKRYGRLHPDGIASTILTKCDPHWGSYIHPEQDRIISIREAARLQAFPDNIRFFGSTIDQYKQVGNAVPPLLARAIGLQIRNCLERRSAGFDVCPDSCISDSQMKLFR